jgi:GT2 family glycosyltransferase
MSVTVVMPVHGNWPVARRALDALRRHGGDHELVVVDDGSPDRAPEGLPAELSDAGLIRNDTSIGFGAACNQGAELAEGEVVCFLNSDAFVDAGALPALTRRLEDPGVGAAAPLLLNEDGSLQEAGGAVGRDGSTYPLGRGASVDDPAWGFRREIDYGSAACLAVRRAAFEEIGGFDEAYTPAYYEDADLCFRLSEVGLRTMLEPNARVTHLQYGSGSQERAQSLVTRNRRTFVDRWGDRLTGRPIVSGSPLWNHRLLALRDAIALVRFLVFADDELASTIASRWPRARVTLIGANGGSEGLELANPPQLDRWLEERRFHYWAILGAPGGADEALSRTQPQAARLNASLDDLVETLSGAGIAPPGEEPVG